MTSIRDAALAWHAAGVSIMPIGANKVPLQKWTHLKGADGRLASAVELENWFPTPGSKMAAVATPHEGFGLITGAVSGGLELIEFEGRAVEEGVLAAFLTLCKDNGAEELFRRVWNGYRQKSPTGGIHIVYRCMDGAFHKNVKLARRMATAAELQAQRDAGREEKQLDRYKVLIETRSEGGYFVAAPSGGRTHPTGLSWELVAGSVGVVPEITGKEQELLFALAQMLDSAGGDTATERLQEVSRERGAVPNAGSTSALDAFEAVTEWSDILEPHGWTYLRTDDRGRSYWLRPGKKLDGAGGDPGFSQSATTGGEERDRLYVFSTSTVFEQERSYTKAGAYAVLEHDGDHKAAQKALSAMGFGRPAAADWASAEKLAWAVEREERQAAEVRQRAAEALKALENPFATQEQREAAEQVLAAAKEAVEGRRFYWHDELDEIDPPEPLITGILDVACIALLSGMNQTYKTFVAIAWACSLATGRAWGPHVVPAARKVLYVAAEGASGINLRIKAWEKVNGPIPKGMLAVFPRPVKVMDDEALMEIEQFIHDNEVGLVVLDTMRKMTPGIEENSSTEMGEAMSKVEGIRERQQCTALWVHHTGYIGTRTRGSSAIEDDSDIGWVIELEDGTDKDVGNRRILKQTKLKDGELAAGRALIFKVEQVETRRGPKTSGVVDVTDNPFERSKPGEKGTKKTPLDPALLRDMVKCITSESKISTSQLQGAASSVHFQLAEYSQPQRNRHLAALQRAGLVRVHDQGRTKIWTVVGHNEISAELGLQQIRDALVSGQDLTTEQVSQIERDREIPR